MRNLFLFTIAALVCGIAYAGGIEPPQVQYSTGSEASGWTVYATRAGMAFTGMASNFTRRWLDGQVLGNPISYLTEKPKRTALAVFTLLGTIGTAIAMGQFDGISFNQILMQSFLLGYAADTLNQGAAKP
jgi:hypothetical protein